MYQLLKSSWRDFRGTYKQHLAFEFAYLSITSILFIPILAYIFNRMLLLMGSGTLINAEVYKLPLSTIGLIGLIVISFIAIFVLFVEFGVITVIAQKKYFNETVLITEAFKTTLAKTPKLIGLGLIQLMLLVLVILPFIDSPITSSFININLPILLAGHVLTSYISIIIYLCVFVLIIYFVIRWIFTIHYIVIEGKSIQSAIKHSMLLTKKNKTSILFNLLCINGILFFGSMALMYLVSLIPALLQGHLIGHLIQYYLTIFSSFAAIIFSLILIPFNIIILTRLFYEFKNKNGEDIKDELKTIPSPRLGLVETNIFQFFDKRKYVLLAVLVVYMTSMFLINENVNENIVYLKWDVEVASHRGDSMNAPENSLSSVKSAISKGVPVIEMDVQITKDGVVVLNHDATLQRVAGVPERVSQLTYEELQQLDIGIRFSEEFEGETIPTLEEVLKVIDEAGVKAMIDLKPDNNHAELAQGVVNVIEQYDLEDSVYIQAFDYKALQEVRIANENLIIGQILYSAAGDLSRLDVDFYTIHQTMLSDQFIRDARRDNRGIWVWTVNIDRTMNHVLRYDIDGLITKNPEAVLRLFQVGNYEAKTE